MGVCQSADQRISKNIDRSIKRDGHDKTQKLLILGPGESGKSTVLKQMRLLHCEGFTAEELEARKGIIYSNIISQLAVMVTSMNDLDIHLENPALQAEGRMVVGLLETGKEMEPLTDDVIAAVKALWADPGIQQCYDRRSEYQLNDCAKFFIESIDRISSPTYVPSLQDMLYSRVPTTGVVQIDFIVQDLQFRVYDVGGQRSERKKWIHCFDDVNAVLYVTAISEYDQKLREDNKTNRLQEAVTLFESICNSMYFVQSSMILFLNKTDLFREKIENIKVPLAVCFTAYEGKDSYEDAVQYIQEQFEVLKHDRTKALYIHETCATDCDQVQKVVNSVIDTIVENSLKRAGMM